MLTLPVRSVGGANAAGRTSDERKHLMIRMEIFDPPMCCSSGVCGPGVDPTLARFAADLDWLRRQGVIVERFALSQRPGAFARNAALMQIVSDGALPALTVDGRVVHTGSYPTRAQLARWAGIPPEDAAAAPKPASKLGACRAALSEGKLLFIAIPGAGGDTAAAVRGARQFEASKDLPPSAVVEFGAADSDGRALLRELGTQAPEGGSVVLFLAPPGTIVGRFTGAPTQRDLEKAFFGARACSPGSGCCG